MQFPLKNKEGKSDRKEEERGIEGEEGQVYQKDAFKTN